MNIYKTKSGKNKNGINHWMNSNNFANNNIWTNTIVNNHKKDIKQHDVVFKSTGTQTEIKEKINNLGEACCICFEDIWVCKTLCKHYICISCLLHIKKECPICRIDMSNNIPNVLKPIANMCKKTNNDNNLNIFDNSQFPHLF